MSDRCLCGMWEIEEYGVRCPSCEIEIERAEDGTLEREMQAYLAFLEELETQQRAERVARIRAYTEGDFS